MIEPLFDSLDVYEAEWKTIEQRPHRVGEADWRPPLKSPQSLVGLALSGGGIRSATFNLGVLQALRRANLLNRADYLSTVSGGGYIGGWWSAWLSRPGRNTADVFPPREAIETWRNDVHAKPARCRACHRNLVPEQGGHHHGPDDASDLYCSPECRTAGPRPASPDPEHHVRLFSNYLTPRKGAMSRDLWRAVTVISRNLVLTWVVLLSMLAIPILFAQAMFAWIYSSRISGPFFSDGAHPLGELMPRMVAVADIPLAFITWFAVLSVIWLMVQRGAIKFQVFVALSGLVAAVWLFVAALPSTGTAPAVYVSGAIVAVFAARIWSTGGIGRDLKVNRISRLQSVTLVAALIAATIAAVAAFGHELVNYVFFGNHAGTEALTVNAGKYLTVATTAAATYQAARAGMPAGGAEARTTTSSRVSRWLLALAPPLILLALVLAISWGGSQAVVKIDDLNKWTSVLRNITLVGIIAMAALAVTEEQQIAHVLPALLLAIGPATILVAEGRTDAAPIYYMGGLAASLLALGFVVARACKGLHQVSRSEWLIGAGALISIAAMAVALGVVPPPDVHLLLNLCGALATVVILLGWTTDPNSLSLHTFYKMRLVRAYLGASNPERTGFDTEDITETKPGDDLPLSEIADASRNAPYHLINATLNLTAGSDMVIAQRAAAPFIFSRHFCGSARTGYRRTETYRSGTLTLGTVIAISGAAASPVMGSQTPKTSLAMLMALLNVRLGYWIPTPNREDWRAPQARFWPFYLLREFFSHTADTGRYCYVTDGGHFDNTGAYALVERACRVIVMTDCGADPDCVFDDLANLVRRCRIDFGAVITFPSLTPFTRDALANDRRAYVVGHIDYRSTHVRSLGWTERDINDLKPEGVLIVVKPTLLAKLETDVNRYSQTNRSFPQQSTGDQWFDEAQFESYRRLGEISGEEAAAEIEELFRKNTPAVAAAERAGV